MVLFCERIDEGRTREGMSLFYWTWYGAWGSGTALMGLGAQTEATEDDHRLQSSLGGPPWDPVRFVLGWTRPRPKPVRRSATGRPDAFARTSGIVDDRALPGLPSPNAWLLYACSSIPRAIIPDEGVPSRRKTAGEETPSRRNTGGYRSMASLIRRPCSRSWTFAEPVAGLALAGRPTY